jgi:hypothetical protein
MVIRFVLIVLILLIMLEIKAVDHYTSPEMKYTDPRTLVETFHETSLQSFSPDV